MYEARKKVEAREGLDRKPGSSSLKNSVIEHFWTSLMAKAEDHLLRGLGVGAKEYLDMLNMITKPWLAKQ